jgi:hypothetical protein
LRLAILFPQPAPGPEEQGLNCRVTDIEALPNIAVAQALNLTQQQDPLVTPRQPTQRLHHRLLLLSHLDRILWSLYLQRGWCRLLLQQGAGSPSLPKDVDGEIAGDPDEPAPEGGAALK